MGTPENFQKVLTGVSTGNKVLKSTSEDNVFVFFSDHGAAGLIAFPSSQLHKSDLQYNVRHYAQLRISSDLCRALDGRCGVAARAQGPVGSRVSLREVPRDC